MDPGASGRTEDADGELGAVVAAHVEPGVAVPSGVKERRLLEPILKGIVP